MLAELISPQSVSTITVILAIGAVVGPILFGFILWKMSNIFVTGREFDQYKSSSANDRSEMRRTLITIETNMAVVMTGIARLEGAMMNGSGKHKE